MTDNDDWIPVAERLPGGPWQLVNFAANGNVYAGYYQAGIWYDATHFDRDGSFDDVYGVTYWRPLPPPPGPQPVSQNEDDPGEYRVNA